MRVVLDTNVLVSALLTPQGVSARILDLIISEKIIPIFDDRILQEYREVLQREKFSLEKNLIDEVLAYMDRVGEYVSSSPLKISLPDKDDLPFLEVALTGKAEVLISGNKKHFGKPPQELKILDSAEFLRFFNTKSF